MSAPIPTRCVGDDPFYSDLLRHPDKVFISPRPLSKPAVNPALQIGLLNYISYFMLTVDIRAVALAQVAVSFATNLVIALLAYTMVKKIGEAKTWAERWAFAVGGALGTVSAILLTKVWFGK